MSVEEARAKLGELVRAAAAGQTTVITYHGVPAAVIAPIHESSEDPQ
jgi:prevent-host-death family protein